MQSASFEVLERRKGDLKGHLRGECVFGLPKSIKACVLRKVVEIIRNHSQRSEFQCVGPYQFPTALQLLDYAATEHNSRRRSAEPQRRVNQRYRDLNFLAWTAPPKGI